MIIIQIESLIQVNSGFINFYNIITVYFSIKARVSIVYYGIYRFITNIIQQLRQNNDLSHKKGDPFWDRLKNPFCFQENAKRFRPEGTPLEQSLFTPWGPWRDVFLL